MKKICSRCNILKDFNEYYKNVGKSNGITCECKLCCKIITRDWALKNREKRLSSIKKWHEKNKSKQKLIMQTWRKENKERCNLLNANRYARKNQRTPNWLTEDDFNFMEQFYKEASRLTKETNIPHEVDHIVPLKGNNVSGLHVPWNLQILTKKDNRKKRNKYE